MAMEFLEGTSLHQFLAGCDTSTRRSAVPTCSA